MHRGSTVWAGAHREDADELVTGWHHHDQHQLQYAFEGVVEVETRTRHLVLPPRQAVWIPAGVRHLTTLRRVRSGSVFFSPGTVPVAVADEVRVLGVDPLLREMVVRAMRWPVDRPRSEPLADAFFTTMALLIAEWVATEAPLFLPVSADPHVAAGLDHTRAHLRDATVAQAAAAAGLSERSFRRHVAAELGITWQEYRQRARLLRAMALLTQPRWTVATVAADVGFDSASAFSRAFAAFSGESPRQYRQRVTTPA